MPVDPMPPSENDAGEPQHSPGWSFPDLRTLSEGLTSLFEGRGAEGTVTVLSREPNPLSGKRSPCEIVTVRLQDGSHLRLFCKYGGYDWFSHSMWGVAYEVRVYREVLSAVNAMTPRFYGVHTASVPNSAWLVLEYLVPVEELPDAPQPDAMIETARWLARFHAETEQLLSTRDMAFLRVYDTAYYHAYAERVLQSAASLGRLAGWLPGLCRRWEELAERVLLPPSTIIHGDFYPSNVLFHHGVPVVVDWESASAAVGEIDLAFQTEGWPHPIVAACEAEYCRVRWAGDPPPEFRQRLAAARVYQHLRWLGDQPKWASRQGFRQLRALAARLQLL